MDRSRLDFTGFWEGPEKVLEAPEPYFSRFIRIIALVLRKRSDPYKTLAGAIEIKVRALAQCMTIDRESLPGAFQTELPAKKTPKMRLGARQVRFWRSPGAS